VIVNIIVQYFQKAEEKAEADNRNQEQAFALIHFHQTTVSFKFLKGCAELEGNRFTGRLIVPRASRLPGRLRQKKNQPARQKCRSQNNKGCPQNGDGPSILA
jgi:hypothetical protein